MLDFTLKSYKSLLIALLNAGYQFKTFEEYLAEGSDSKFVILRHDVDELANNALKIATLEHSLGIKSTYFFRIVKQSNNPGVIKKIVSMGHSIGYHYEDFSFAGGNYEEAIASFKENLEYFRQFYPVNTVCMHGSSSSKYDNRLLWNRYSLSDFGIIGEPYLSIDFDDVYYVTDTGYAWDGGKFAVRDVVVNNHGLSFHKTSQIVDAIKEGRFPDKVMILAHTLWSDNLAQWTALHIREFLRNNVKRLSKENKFVADIYGKLVAAYWKNDKKQS